MELRDRFWRQRIKKEGLDTFFERGGISSFWIFLIFTKISKKGAWKSDFSSKNASKFKHFPEIFKIRFFVPLIIWVVWALSSSWEFKEFPEFRRRMPEGVLKTLARLWTMSEPMFSYDFVLNAHFSIASSSIQFNCVFVHFQF